MIPILAGALPVLAMGGIGWSIGEMAIAAILIIAVIAILVAFVRYSGIVIPQIVVTVFWIFLGAAFCIFVIKLLMQM